MADITTTQEQAKPYLTIILRVKSPTVWYAHHLTESQLCCQLNKPIVVLLAAYKLMILPCVIWPP